MPDKSHNHFCTTLWLQSNS